MRAEHGNDFFIDVENIGRFRFGRRTQRDVYAIRSEYNRLSNGNYLGDSGMPADMGAWAVATLVVLMVSAPPEFDPLNNDPLTDDTWEDKTASVYQALRAKELSFRPERPPAEQAAGP